MASDGYVLITGASSGLGEAFARKYARRGRSLVLVARSGDRLAALADELAKRHGVWVNVVPMDLAVDGAALALHGRCVVEGWDVDVLVNNAGFGLGGELLSQPLARVEEMVRLNVATVVGLTRLFLPAMKERRRGAVLHVASTAAFQALPYFAVYAATKAFVLSFSEALHVELSETGVTVTALCPGPTETSFFDAAQLHKERKGLALQSAEEVVRVGLEAVEAGRMTVISGGMNRAVAWATRLVPRTVAARLGARFAQRPEK